MFSSDRYCRTLGACGPIVTGDSLDYKKAGDVILVGSHSRDNCLEVRGHSWSVTCNFKIQCCYSVFCSNRFF